MKPQVPHQRAILWAGVASLAAYVLPIVSIVLLPIQYLNTHFHELFHALACVFTGGSVSTIGVHADGSGVTMVSGGSQVIVTSAGYLGTAALGVFVLMAAKTAEGARKWLWALTAGLGLAMVLWVRGDAVGVLSGFFWIAALGFAAMRLRGEGLLLAVAFLGVQLCLHSVQSLLVLLNLSAFTGVESDAAIMGSATGIPALFWALLWTGIGGLFMFTGLKRAWSR